MGQLLVLEKALEVLVAHEDLLVLLLQLAHVLLLLIQGKFDPINVVNKKTGSYCFLFFYPENIAYDV